MLALLLAPLQALFDGGQDQLTGGLNTVRGTNDLNGALDVPARRHNDTATALLADRVNLLAALAHNVAEQSWVGKVEIANGVALAGLLNGLLQSLLGLLHVLRRAVQDPGNLARLCRRDLHDAP